MLLVKSPVTEMRHILEVLENTAKEGASLAIFAPEISGEALNAIVTNNLRQITRVNGVVVPGSDAERDELLDQLHVLTRAPIVDLTEEDHASSADLRHAELLVSTSKKTAVSDGDAIDLVGEAPQVDPSTMFPPAN